MVISVVGSGGKTTLIHELRDKYINQGKKVFVTTTTHMFCEADTVMANDYLLIKEKIDNNGYCMAGLPVNSGRSDTSVEADKCKIGPLKKELYEKICKEADVVLVEADGSRHLPLKFPNELEPVIPDNTDYVIVVTGLFALDKLAKDVIHRYEIAGISPNKIVTPELIENLIERGYLNMLRSKFSENKIYIHPTGADTIYGRVIAELLREKKSVSLVKKEWFNEKPKLILCGGGHVANYVEKVGRMLEFDTIVIDDREEFANRKLYPDAKDVICRDFSEVYDCLPEGDNNYYVIVTRGHAADKVCLDAVLKRKYAYVGMIGSKKKVAETFDKLRKEGISEEVISTIHSPIGLSIGAVTPAEISISIMAEIIEEKNKKNMGSMPAELMHYMGKGVLCIITEKTGSAPRGIGSMMLVKEENEIIGTIGGGTVENAVIEEAKNISEISEEIYDLSSEENAKLGMICGGTVKIIFIPLMEELRRG